MDEISTKLAECLNHAKHVRYLSADYRRAVGYSWGLLIRFSGATRLLSCTRNVIENWLTDGASKGWKPTTFWAHHRNIGFLFRYLKERGEIDDDPTRNIRLPKLGRRLPKGLSYEEATRLLAATRRIRFTYKFEGNRNLAMIAIILYAGLRRGELVGLQMADVDLQRGIITVIEGKGMKDRVIPIHRRLAPILAEYLAARERLGKTCGGFFTSSQRDKPITVRSVDRAIKLIRAGSKIYFSAHILRHTFATLMLEGGCDIYSLSKMMGHEKITTTTIYLGCSTRLLTAAMAMHPLA